MKPAATSLVLVGAIAILLISGYIISTGNVKSVLFAASQIDFYVQINTTAKSSTIRDPLMHFDEHCHLGDSYKEWFERKVPILKTIILHRDSGLENATSIRILLTTKHLTTRGPRKRRERYNIWAHQQQWHCNSGEFSSNSSVPTLAKLVGTGDHHGHTLLFECPSSIHELHTLSSHGPGGNVTYAGNLSEFYHCQTKDHPMDAALRHFTNLSFVAQTMLAFAPARRMLPSWIEYHRIIMGIQHFFVYVNEPWETFTSDEDYFYHPPYVTYVPFRESFGLYPLSFQQAAQIDAIQRLKGTSVEWVAMMDVDEYFQLSTNGTEWSEVHRNRSESESSMDKGSLLRLLRQQLELADTDNNDNVASFNVGADIFGYHPYDNSSALKDLPICAQVGRRLHSDGMKLFARPDYTNYISVHMLSGGEKQIPLDSDATGLRHGHFHAERERFDDISEVVLDTSFRHQGCNAVRQELQAYFPRYKDDHMAAPPELYGYDTEQDAGSRKILPGR